MPKSKKYPKEIEAICVKCGGLQTYKHVWGWKYRCSSCGDIRRRDALTEAIVLTAVQPERWV